MTKSNLKSRKRKSSISSTTTPTTRRSSNSNNRRVNTTNIKKDFLSQLTTLRNFVQDLGVGATTYTEGDLSNCLRDCGYNVHRAGERLITGQFRSSNISGSSTSGIGGSGGGGGGGSGRKRKGVSSFFDATRSPSPTTPTASSTVTSLSCMESASSLVSPPPREQSPASIVDVDRRKDPIIDTKSSYSSFKSNSTVPSKSIVTSAKRKNEHQQHQQQEHQQYQQQQRKDYKVSSKLSSSLHPPKPVTKHPTTTNTKTRTTNNYTQQSPLLLCHRWIVAFSTSRRGSTRYLEPIHISASTNYSSSKNTKNTTSSNSKLKPKLKSNAKSNATKPNSTTTTTTTSTPKGATLVRFRASNLQGTLDNRLGSILSPLLRYTTSTTEPNGDDDGALIQLDANALMEDGNITMLTEVPMEVRISIRRPLEFFGLFDAVGAGGGTGGAFWGVGGSKAKGGGVPVVGRKVKSCVDAAYALLQWSKFGDCALYNPVASLGVADGGGGGSGDGGSTGRIKSEGVGVGVANKPSSVLMGEDGSTTSNVGEGRIEGDDDGGGGGGDDDDESKLFRLVQEGIVQEPIVRDDDDIENDDTDKITRPDWVDSITDANSITIASSSSAVVDVSSSGSKILKGEDEDNEEEDAKMLRDNGVTLRPYQRQALRWMMRREGHCYSSPTRIDGDVDGGSANDLIQHLALLAELASTSSSSSSSSSDSILPSPSRTSHSNNGDGDGDEDVMMVAQPNTSHHPQVRCEVGPVRVSEEMARKALPLRNSSIDDGDYNSHSDAVAAGRIAASVQHPLWERRFLWSRGDYTTTTDNNYDANKNDDDRSHDSSSSSRVYAIYVNELLQTASHTPPNPPRRCVGGILADAMGLGKTVMLLSLVAKVKEDEKMEEEEAMMTAAKRRKRGGKTTLVVAPLSLLSQWEEEIGEKTDLSYFAYYSDTARSRPSIDKYDVVVTTYGMLQQEYLSTHNTKQQPLKPTTALLTHKFQRIILDEAHIIKNPSTSLSKACCALDAERRWCVTGTPIQNSLQDVFGLIKFLRHEPWCDGRFWKAAITDVISLGDGVGGRAGATSRSGADGGKTKVEDKAAVVRREGDDGGESDIARGGAGNLDSIGGMEVALDRVRRVLLPLMMRRTKETLSVDGKPIITLPPIQFTTIKIELSHPERQFYNALLDRSQATFDGLLRAGTASKSWFAIFSLLQRLRQSCNHVGLAINKSHMLLVGDNGGGDSEGGLLLTKKKKVKSPVESQVVEEEMVDSGVGEVVTDNFLHKLLDTFHGETTNNNDNTILSKQPTTMATTATSTSTGKTSTSTTYADKIAHALSQAVPSNDSLDEECPICLERPKCGDLAVTPCAHIFCRTCLTDALNKGTSGSAWERTAGLNGGRKRSNSSGGTSDSSSRCRDGECPICMTWINSSKIIFVSKQSSTGQALTSTLSQMEQTTPPSSKLQHNGNDNNSNNATATKELLEYALTNNSSKMLAIIQELDKIWTLDPHSKIIIFSQYLGFLDLLQTPLTQRGIAYFRLDGKMTRKERQVTLKSFNSFMKPTTSCAATKTTEDATNHQTQHRGTVLLASMKACGVGINLVSASSVFLVDPWWNSAVEEQCINRIHRIGQLADVVRVRKFLVEDSVEEHIVRLQRKKSRMAGSILGSGDEVSGGRDEESSNPTLEDFKAIFGTGV